VTNQAFAILIRGRTLEQRAKLGPNDIIIDPPLGRFPSADFSRVGEALRAGQIGAESTRAQLAQLSLSDEQYVRYLAARQVGPITPPVVEFVRPGQDSEDYAAVIAATMSDLVDKPLDKDVLRDRLSSLYALDLFETIDYNLINDGGRTGIELSLRRKSWGPNYVRVGLNLEDDFEGNSRYNAALRFIMTELNGLGAEWLTDVQIGENPKLFTEFYQPVSLASRYFLAPRFEFEERSVFRLREEDRIAQYRVRTLEGGLDVGRELSNWGEVRFGVRRGTGRSHVLIGQDTDVVPLEDGESVPLKTFERGGFFTRFSYDKLDSIYFPRRGQQFELEWRAEREAFGADQEFDTVSGSWLIARSVDRHTLIFWTDFGTTIDDVLSSENYFSLGGFFNLSGLAPGFLSGPHYGVGRLIYYRKIGRGGSGLLDLPAYAGFSLEAGNTWADKSDASFGALRKDASLFLGVDTPLGPVYLATGFDEGGGKAFYLFLGRTF
jgi:NTE family protein